MIVDRLIDFIEALRASGVPISILESIDATSSLKYVDISQKEMVKSYLAGSLIKDQSHRKVFDQLFDVYFSSGSTAENMTSAALEKEISESFADVDDDELREMIASATQSGDVEALKAMVSLAVSRYAGIEPGRPVGGRYYAYRTYQGLNMDKIQTSIFDGRVSQLPSDDSLGRKLINREVELELAKISQLVEDEIRRRMVGERGPEAVARTLRATLPQDIDFMYAGADELNEIERSLEPLVRKLATRLERQRRHGGTGSLDYRATIRKSMAYGGVPIDLVYHRAFPSKPELVVVADISGSVASFARFTLLMLYALSGQFSKVRSFVFIDEIDEVTEIFDKSDDINEAMTQVNSRAKVVWMDGHSDYGRVLESFFERWGQALNHNSTVLILGDARNNYHPSRAGILANLRMKVRQIHWLNPEPASYWDSGDSIIGEYGIYCDSVNECRNLRQLQSFVRRLA
ncbi:MAG: VWA domain-containing protein [Actinobacteria bacterium]|nr:VWA domain-containing protein [Actinomycetota bacterium]